MIIEQLTLINWGPHQKLNWDLDAPIVGLIGPNGSGKTNLLEAISFVFTGKLAKNSDGKQARRQEQYIYAVNGVAADNASVQIKFRKGGLRGEIFRQIGKTSKRWLTWEGHEKGAKVTKGGDIDRLMEEIMDCDKEALDLSVFLTQGGVGKFLFLSEAKREGEFAKMCLIDHLDTVGEIAAQEIARVSKDLVDLGPAKDEALRTRQEQLDALEVAETSMKTLRDRTGEIGIKRETLQLLDRVNRSAVALGAAQTVKEAFLPLDEASTPEELRQTVAAKEAAIQAHAQAVKLAEQAKLQLEEKQSKLARLATISVSLNAEARLRAELAELETRGTALAAQVKQLEEDLAAANVNLQEQATLKAQADNMVRIVGAATQAEAELVQAQAALTLAQAAEAPSVEDEQELAEQVIATEKEIVLIPFVLQMAAAGECADDKCVLCGSTDWHGLPGPEELAKLTLQLQQGRDKIRDLQAAGRALHALRASIAGKVQVATAGVGLCQGKIDELRRELLEAKIPTRPADIEGARTKVHLYTEELGGLRKTLDSQREAYSALRHALSQMDALRSEQATLQTQTAAYPADTELLDAMRPVAPPEGVQAEKQNLEQRLNNLTRHLAEFDRIKTDLARAEQALADVTAELSRHKVAKAETGVNTATELETLEAVQREYLQGSGALENAKLAFRRAEVAVRKIEERVEAQAHVQDVISQLETLRSHFSRTGLQRHYLSRIFETLVEITQEQLSEWEEDFQVVKDPDNLFNFLFFRSFDPDTFFDQGQLSGGQKIRLALAFVMAVQEVMFPSLRFLCVDEPSTHLDESGKEGLVRIFRKIAERNQHEDAQVLVVDHAPELAAGFTKTFALKKHGE